MMRPVKLIPLIALAAIFSSCTIATDHYYASSGDSTGVKWRSAAGATYSAITVNHSIPIKEGGNALGKDIMAGAVMRFTP